MKIQTNNIFVCSTLLVILFLACQPKTRLDIDFTERYQLLISDLEEGDIIFRKGFGFTSNMIVRTLAEQKPISHVGIIWKDSSQYKVVQSLPPTSNRSDGVQSTTLVWFVYESKEGSIMVYRPTYQDFETCRNYLLQEVNKKTPFDSKFDMKDDSEIYCIELIWKAWQTQDTMIQSKTLEGRYFEEIINYQGMKFIYSES